MAISNPPHSQTSPTVLGISFEDETEYEIDDLDRPVEKYLAEIRKVIVYNTDWTTETLYNQILRQNIQLTPPFQRRDAWTVPRKSRLIESLLLGFPVPPIVLATAPNTQGKFIVLDGKQRLLSILQFYGGSETPNDRFSLQGLQFRSDLNGLQYDHLLDSGDRSALDNQTIRTVLIRNWKTENLLRQMFLRLNQENTPLSPQELRQALYPGPFVQALDQRAVDSPALRQLLRSDQPDPRMQDTELLLRYTAFQSCLGHYRGSLRDFLNFTCDHLNQAWLEPNRHLSQNSIVQTLSSFEEAVETGIRIFGAENFAHLWLPQTNQYHHQLNRAILDMFLFYFADAQVCEGSLSKQDKVIEAYQRLCGNSEFRQAVRSDTSSLRSTYTRLEQWGRALQDILDGLSLPIPRWQDGSIVVPEVRS